MLHDFLCKKYFYKQHQAEIESKIIRISRWNTPPPFLQGYLDPPPSTIFEKSQPSSK